VNVRRFTLAVDLDGVVVDYHGAFTRHCAEELGLPVSERPVPSTWSYHEAWPDVFANQEEFLRAHASAVERGLFATAEPIPGAVAALQRLSDAEVHIRVVTSRLLRNGQHALVAGQTVTWLDEHRIPYRSLALERDDKRQIRADIAVDDSPTNVCAWRSVGVPCATFDQPYNRAVEGLRVADWTDLETLVRTTQQWWLADPLRDLRV
jgi:5'-nucleotidase